MSERLPQSIFAAIEGGKVENAKDGKREAGVLIEEVKHMASDPNNDTFDFSNLPPLPETENE